MNEVEGCDVMSPGLEMMIKEYDASTVDDEYSDVSPIYSLAQRQETEMSRSQRHSWDICEKLLPRVSESVSGRRRSRN